MKKILLIALICISMVLPQMTVAAVAEIKVKVNGTLLKLDAKPYSEKGTVMVPVKNIAQALKFKISGDGTATTVLAKGTKVIKLKTGTNVVVVDSKEVKAFGTSKVKGGRTFIPVSFVKAFLNCTADWFPKNSIVAVNEGTKDGSPTLFRRLIQSEEYKVVDYTGATKGYTYVPKDTKAKLRIIGSTRNENMNCQDGDIRIELLSLDKYTRQQAREVLKFCLPKDYETVYMYLIVTMRREAYEHINELSLYPGIRAAIHENRQVYTSSRTSNTASVSINYAGYRSKPEWFRYRTNPEFLKSSSDQDIIKAWGINEYTYADYYKVRGNVYLYRAYKRDGYSLYTYGAYTPPGTQEIESFSTEDEAEEAGYIKDDFFNLYLDEYN